MRIKDCKTLNGLRQREPNIHVLFAPLIRCHFKCSPGMTRVTNFLDFAAAAASEIRLRMQKDNPEMFKYA
jgi:hypothetical protein